MCGHNLGIKNTPPNPDSRSWYGLGTEMVRSWYRPATDFMRGKTRFDEGKCPSGVTGANGAFVSLTSLQNLQVCKLYKPCKRFRQMLLRITNLIIFTLPITFFVKSLEVTLYFTIFAVSYPCQKPYG